MPSLPVRDAVISSGANYDAGALAAALGFTGAGAHAGHVHIWSAPDGNAGAGTSRDGIELTGTDAQIFQTGTLPADSNTGWLIVSPAAPVPEPGTITIFAVALAGAAVGFLWFNAHPAQVFMGDTGSLALGGALGVMAILLKAEFLLVIVGGVFVLETLSVAAQVGYFKYTRRRYGEGRRIFRMTPIHHHFEKLGWPETKVVVRFWILGVLFAMLAI